MRLVSRRWNDVMEVEAVELISDDAEDTWHLYNLIQPGDFVGGKAVRKVAKLDSGPDDHPSSSTGPKATERMIIDVVLAVTSTSYDPVVGGLRVSGRNIRESEYISLGASQSMDVQMHMAYRVGKAGGWDSVAEEMLADALRAERAGEGGIAAVVMDDVAANVCLVTPNRTVHLSRIAAERSRKGQQQPRKGPSSSSSSSSPYFETTLATLLRSFDFAQPRPLILASPGFVAANFKTYISQNANEKRDALLKAIARNITVVATSSGTMHGLNAVMGSNEMRAAMSDMRFTQESRHLDHFTNALKLGDGRAHYGARTVERAAQHGAIGPGGGLLIISNALFRSSDLAERKRFVALVDSVKAAGGEVRIISSEHDSGKRLALLGNVAAVLNFPMPELDEEDEEEAEEETVRKEEEEPSTAAQGRREGVDDLVEEFVS